MGMYLQLRRVNINVLTSLAELKGDDDSAYKILSPADEEDPAHKDRSIADLDKAWHAIHFLLAGDEWDATLPAGFLLSGTPVGADLGYGEARILTPVEVDDVSKFLSRLPDDFVEKNFDHAALEKAQIYPTIWDRKDPEDIKYVSSHFKELKSIVQIAAANGEGLALAIL